MDVHAIGIVDNMKKSSISGKQYLDYLSESRGTLVLHLGGVGKYTI